MALTAKQFIEGIYVAYFGRAGDPAGVGYWRNLYNQGQFDFAGIAENFAQQEEATDTYAYFNAYFNYPGYEISDSMREAFVTEVYQNLFNRAPDADGLAYWLDVLESGASSPGAFIAQIINAAYEGREGESADDWNNLWAKIQVAEYYTDQVVETGAGWSAAENLDDAQAAIAGITASSDLEAAFDAVDSLISGTVNVGQTFTLTVGEDSGPGFVGTSANDTFNAPVVQDNAGTPVDTLESFDILDGGAGTDTLNATINSGNPAPVLKNIENVNLRFTAAKSVDLTSATGVTAIKVENSTAAGTVAGVGAVASLGVANQLKNVNFDGSTATSLALSLDTVGNATTQVVVDLGPINASKATTLDLTATNANAEVTDTKAAEIITTLTVDATGTNTLQLTEAVKATSVAVSGTGSVDMTGAAFTGALTKFDASANEGGVKADIRSTKAVAVTTGAGADVIDMDTAVQNDTSVALGAGDDALYVGALLGSFTKGVDGGEGTDIINITNGATLDATTSKYITNFETLDVSGGTGNYDVSLNSFDTVQIDEAINGALAAGVDFKNAPDDFTLNIASQAKTDADFAVANTITVTGKDYTGTTAKGTAETFTLVATIHDGNKDNTADGNINANTVTVAGVENVVVEANVGTLDGGTDALKASKHTLTVDLVTNDAETLTIKGDASVDLSGVTTIGVVTKVDASGSTGDVTIDFSGHAKSVAYIGSDGVDTYSAGKAGDTIYTGKGADVVTLDALAGNEGAVRDIFVLKAATDSQITDTSKDGKITLGADTGFDDVSNFDTVGDPTVANTSDRLDLTNFGFTGAQRGVADVSGSVTATTDLTSVADLFNTPAGDRGVAYTVIGSDSYVLVDVNKDGDFTAADDLVVKLTGVGAVSETMINF